MIRKLVAIFVALLINCAIFAWLNSWSTATVADVTPAVRADRIPTLPTITVRPTRAQLELLHRYPAPANTSSTLPTGNGRMQAFAPMPYYSFAERADTTRTG